MARDRDIGLEIGEQLGLRRAVLFEHPVVAEVLELCS